MFLKSPGVRVQRRYNSGLFLFSLFSSVGLEKAVVLEMHSFMLSCVELTTQIFILL